MSGQVESTETTSVAVSKQKVGSESSGITSVIVTCLTDMVQKEPPQLDRTDRDFRDGFRGRVKPDRSSAGNYEAVATASRRGDEQ